MARNSHVQKESAQSQLAMRKNTAGERRAAVGAKSALGEYTPSAAGHNGRHLPEQLNHKKYKVEAGLFDNGEAQQIRDLDDRGQVLRDLDTVMTPFMRN